MSRSFDATSLTICPAEARQALLTAPAEDAKHILADRFPVRILQNPRWVERLTYEMNIHVAASLLS